MIFMDKTQLFHNKSQRAKTYVLDSLLFREIYIGVFRSINGIPDFYASNHDQWMEEYISKQLWFVDPIVKDSLTILDEDKETFMSWGMEITDETFVEYRSAYIGYVKGFSKVFHHHSPTNNETYVVGIGLYPEHIDQEKPLNLNAIFTAAKQRLEKFSEQGAAST